MAMHFERFGATGLGYWAKYECLAADGAREKILSAEELDHEGFWQELS